MARGLIPEAVTAEDVILACGGTLPPVPELPDRRSRSRSRRSPARTQTKTADLVAQAGRGADRSYGLPPVPVLHEHHRFDQIDHRRRYDRAGKPSNLSVCALYSLVVPVCCLHYAPVTPEGLCPQVPRAKRKLAKRTIVAAVLILLLIPLTLYIGVFYLGNKNTISSL